MIRAFWIFVGLSFLPASTHASLFAGPLNEEMSVPGALHSLIKKETPIAIELGLEYEHPSFSGMPGIIVDNPQISSTTQVSKGNLENHYPEVFLQTLKVQALLSERSRWTLSLRTVLPLNSLAEMNTGNIYLPEFVLYRAEAQRPRVYLSSGVDLNPDWRVGLGVDVGFSVSSQATIYLQSGSGTYSDQTLSAKMNPSLIPQGSIQFQNYAFTLRGENKSTLDLDTHAVARVFGDVNAAAANFNYHTQSALYYQPWEFEFSGKNPMGESFTFKWALSYQLWSGYQAHAAVIASGVSNNCTGGNTGGNCTSTFSPTQSPEFRARNLIVPQGELAWQLSDRWGLSAGYRYKDSIFKDLPQGNTNYLDPPRHDFMLSTTWVSAAHLELKVHALVSRLTSQSVVKSNPSADVGGPGYDASGWIYGGGMSVAIPFRE